MKACVPLIFLLSIFMMYGPFMTYFMISFMLDKLFLEKMSLYIGL